MGLEFFAAVSAPGYLATYAYYFFPLSRSVVTFPAGTSAFLFTAAATASMVDPSSVSTLDAGSPVSLGDTGLVYAIVVDCQGHAAPGVQFTTDEPGVGNFGGSALGLTEANGVAVFAGDPLINGNGSLGVPAGNLQLTATVPALGKTIGQVTVYVQPGGWTTLQLGPQP